ncbi:MAG: IS3 family transposase [Nitrospirota bacterium]|nr:IS3 family transposase [Nitrospirota bacterium]
MALAAIKGDKTLAELAEQFSVHPTQVTEWKQQLLARAADVFGGSKPPSDMPDLKTLHAKIGQLALEKRFFRRGAHQGGLAERNAMMDRTHALPVVRQGQLLGVARATAYYQPTPVSAAELALMRRLDERHLRYPFAGARMLRDLLRHEGHAMGRRHVAPLMRRMGLTAVSRKPSLSRRHPAHRIYPYLLRNLAIVRPNHVWAADITYIPMRRGFVYLFAVLDGASRRVLAWRLSNTLTTDFCLEAVREAITRYGRPEMFNTDQGCQFTSQEFTGLLPHHGIQISMDGKGCWRDNVFVERLRKSLKYEEVYWHAYETISAAHQGLERYLTFYNQTRPHQALDGRTPDRVYWENRPAQPSAA